jgi:hypothetical protein
MAHHNNIHAYVYAHSVYSTETMLSITKAKERLLELFDVELPCRQQYNLQ